MPVGRARSADVAAATYERTEALKQQIHALVHDPGGPGYNTQNDISPIDTPKISSYLPPTMLHDTEAENFYFARSTPNVCLPQVRRPPVARLVWHRDTHHTKATIKEICLMSLTEDCVWGVECRRVHPRAKRNFNRKVITIVEFIKDDEGITIPHPSPEHVDPMASPPSQPTVRIPHSQRDLLPRAEKHFRDVPPRFHKSHRKEPRIVSASADEPPIGIHRPEDSFLPIIEDDPIPDQDPIEDFMHDWSESSPSESGSSSSGWEYQPNADDWVDLPSTDNEIKYASPVTDPPIGRRPRPRNSERCIPWLRGRCDRRYSCKYVHDDLDYDPEPLTPTLPAVSSKLPTSSWTLPIHGHMKVKVTAGFDVQEIVTGFETPWVFLDQIPTDTTSEEIMSLVSLYGSIVDYKMPTTRTAVAMVKIRFSNDSEAQSAASALNGSRHFNTMISAHLPIHAGGRTATFRDTTVRITWEAPGIVGYGGYPTHARAEAAILACTTGPLRGSYVWAVMHHGLPAVNAFTVKFHNLPLDVTKEDMKRFAEPLDMMWDQPNYRYLSKVVKWVRRLIDGSDLVDFDVLPPPYRSGRVTAFANFNNANAAKAAASLVNGRLPTVTGRTRVFANHLLTLRFTVLPDLFTKISPDLRDFQESVRKRPMHVANVIIEPPKPPMPAVVRISAAELKELGRLKTELECLLHGEVLRQARANVWNGYFNRPPGIMFLHELQRQIKGLRVEKDFYRRTLTLFGPMEKRRIARERILAIIDDIQATHEVRTIPLQRPIVGLFITEHLVQLQKELGHETVFIDIWNSVIVVRGSLADFEVVMRQVQQLQTRRYPRRANIVQCPICFDEVSVPIKLHCGHAYCQTCLTNYMVAATTSRFFPLTCLGDEGRCSQLIPLAIGRRVLSVSQFDTVIQAAFDAYVDSRPNEFHRCPTVDCQQVYRSAPAGTVLQCPSCLLRICPECHVEYHDGFSCPDRNGGDALFKEWAQNHDVKKCPGCKAPIERDEGCNHVTCTRCQTHICWVCMQTFPRGEGIYGHMRVEHGGFGLEPIYG